MKRDLPRRENKEGILYRYQTNTETVKEEKESVALLFCWAKGEHNRLVPQELCHPPW